MKKKLFAGIGLLGMAACLTAAINLQQVNTTSPQTLSGPKTLVAPIFSGSITGTYTLAGTPTITGPLISNPVFSGTATGTYTLGGSPTLVAAILSGSMTGTYTLAGTPTITSPAISNPVFSGTATGTYTLGGVPTIASPTLSGTVAGTYTLGGSPTLGSALAAGGQDITGIDELDFNNGGSASTTRRLRASLLSLTWHDGTSAKNLATSEQVSQSPIINGSMNIWQRGTAFAAVANGAYTADRITNRYSTTGVVTINRSTNVPTVAQAGILFNYSLEVDVTTADAAVGATDEFTLIHKIEGYNWRPYAQRQMTLSFWVMSTKTGAHGISVSNGTDRFFLSTYTISQADTWEFKTLTIGASPSAGTWNYTTGTGLDVNFNLMAGSALQGTASAVWQTGAPLYGTSSTANVLDNTANFFRVTGIKLELGPVATPIQFALFQDELDACQRYYQKSFTYATAPAQNAGAGTGETRWMANAAGAVAVTSPSLVLKDMRATPTTITLYNPAAANAQVRNITDAADLSASATAVASDKQFTVTATGTAGTAIGEVLAVHWTADAEL